VPAGKRCRTCTTQQKQAVDDRRGTSTQRGYDVAWRVTRRLFLEQNPLCADPFRVHGARLVPAEEVHHVRPIAERRDLRLDPDNLMALCKSCHSRITADGGAGGRLHLHGR
jgi:5-methylcytosine-specific restriction protein A